MTDSPLALPTASWVRDMRERYGLRQKEVARELAISPSLWKKIEQGKRRLTPELRRAYLAILEQAAVAQTAELALLRRLAS